MWEVKPSPDAWAEIREHNRADHRELRSYLVVGPKAVHGAEPGTVVELSLTEGEASALIEAGHLALVSEAPKVEVPPKDEDEDEGEEEQSDQDDLSDSED